MIAESPYDVVVLGGGLAGLTLTRQLLMKHPELRIAVIDKRIFPVAETTCKVGESTVEIGAHYFGEELKLKKHLTDDQLPKFGLRFFFKDAFQSLDQGTEVGGSEFFSSPSYQVDRGRLENHLAQTTQEMGATLLSGAGRQQCRCWSILLPTGSTKPSILPPSNGWCLTNAWELCRSTIANGRHHTTGQS